MEEQNFYYCCGSLYRKQGAQCLQLSNCRWTAVELQSLSKLNG